MEEVEQPFWFLHSAMPLGRLELMSLVGPDAIAGRCQTKF